ncbi:hypothetical protein [Paenibacillus ehimensis]|uniref:hypothetical protein n=1 Tax=Paenibacillus ehimensis TaxID=79264 RepID=UPI0013E3CB1D|nr:hypothetical protein [Paenibacillus ehimensis]
MTDQGCKQLAYLRSTGIKILGFWQTYKKFQASQQANDADRSHFHVPVKYMISGILSARQHPLADAESLTLEELSDESFILLRLC